MDKYYEQVVACVKDHVLPAHCKLYEKCGGNVVSAKAGIAGKDRSSLGK